MKKVLRSSGIIASALLLTLAVGCGNKEAAPDTKAKEVAATATPAATPAATPTATGAPAYKVDEEKAAALLAQFGGQTPNKVVTVSVSLTEILNVLGVKPVGVPTSTVALPEALKDVTKIGSALKPDIEKVTSLQPDIVVGPASIKDSLNKQFGPANLKTAFLPADSLEELKLSTVVLSRVYKKEKEANDFLAKLAEQEKSIEEQSKGKQAPKVMFLFGSAESFMMMNENTFAGSVAKKLGAKNVVSEVLKSKETYVALNMENVVAANPDVILLVAHGDPNTAIKKFEEDVKKNGAWDKLNAFKNGKVKALDYNLYGVASVAKAGDAYKQMFNFLYQ
ncbi:helical backbone metal receptor [Paenibacillus sp. N1-5-1-14]|uniref:helical backbone metal receptor n=1 Tax=Paenibacillus radicibacter TaxID=2972488 RepID=UPI0021590A4E|nr:helical backbone metal receptor [Paenibacillus radicibacter]MCR8644517.1 helical backbone metal receptor [Paenibacillus radicibacter]